MHFPPIRESEFLDGYRGRLAVANNIHSKYKLSSALKAATIQNHPETQLNKVDFAHMLPPFIGVDGNKLIIQNSLGGLALAFMRMNESQNARASSNFQRQAPLARMRESKVWLCPDCVEADLAADNFSFWRRDHQTPGQYKCLNHNTHLRFIERPDLMTQAPHEAIPAAKHPDPDAVLFAGISQNAFITSQLMLRFVQGAMVRCRHAARLNLLDRSKHLFDTDSSWTASALLHRKIMSSAPTSWISDINQKAALNATHSTFVASIIEQDHQPRAAGLFALVAAWLCPSLDDAIDLLGLDC